MHFWDISLFLYWSWNHKGSDVLGVSLRKRKMSHSAASVWLCWHQGQNIHSRAQGRRENSPSNEQWTTRLHPGKRWCRNTGSFENRGRSVSIYYTPWAFTVYVLFFPADLPLCPLKQRKQHLRCVCRNVFVMLLWLLQKNCFNRIHHRFMWNKPPQLSDGAHVTVIKTSF